MALRMTNLCRFLDVEQLFAVGIGFDLAGAFLLARGLLASPRDIAQRTGTYFGSNTWATVSAAQDRVDAFGGLVALGVGFLFQAGGYVALLDHTFDPSPRLGKAIVGVGLAVLAFAVVVIAWRASRRPLVNRQVVEIAHYPLDQDERLDLPLGPLLQELGRALGEPLGEGEDSMSYLRRVFDVTDAFYGERPYWRASEGPPVS
jgi:hypothetical protein